MTVSWSGSRLAKSLLIALICLVFIAPILIGLIGTWLPALGYLPGLNSNYDSSRYLSLDAMAQVFAHPSTVASLKLSVGSALSATFIAFVLSQWLCLNLYRSALWGVLKHSIAPLLAIPHLAFSVGLVFLISPSGWLMRLVSPVLTGMSIPPDWLIVNDTYAASLTLGLVLKETPFFLLMSLSALSRFEHQKTLQIAASLGYSHPVAWQKLIFPQMYPQLRLPMLAVLSYSLSVIDISLVLGPNAPATFAVLVNQWFGHSDLNFRYLGAAGASLLLLLVLMFILLLYIIEVFLKKATKSWLVAGAKDLAKEVVSQWMAKVTLFFMLLVSVGCMAGLLVWSFSQRWRFPDALPELYSLKYWQKSGLQLLEPLQNTAIIGISSALIAVLICIALLQWQSKVQLGSAKPGFKKSLLWLIYVPMLVPQVSFLFGVQVLMVRLNLDGQLLSVIWIHLLFVMPYAYLTLAQVYLRFDERYLQQASILCQSKWRAFIYVKLPMLFKPIAFSFAVAFAVSVAQYLPTLYIGAGRVNTITLESVVLAGGSDARVSAVFALWQFILPLIVYVAALVIPQICFRNRREL
ncbi:MAG: ABC transporter permease subunit [Oceanospirillaceae bacterium]|nr:ABC transporter permease subunit [Oceanospirillaceae bacterium]